MGRKKGCMEEAVKEIVVEFSHSLSSPCGLLQNCQKGATMDVYRVANSFDSFQPDVSLACYDQASLWYDISFLVSGLNQRQLNDIA